MVEVSPTDYARSGDAYIAYRVSGRGSLTVVLISDWFSHVEEMWSPTSPFLSVLEPLASFGRLVTFDQRGVGLSDPVPFEHLPTLEQWMQDLDAVIGACGGPPVAIVTKGSGGAVGLLYAASHPGCVSALVLVNSYARLAAADDYSIGVPPRIRDALLSTIYPPSGEVLGGGEMDESTLHWWERYLHISASPSTTAAMRRMLFDVDVRAVLPSIQTPTLVLHRRDDKWIRLAHGRYLAEHIAEARLVELSGGADLIFAGDTGELVSELEEFLTGSRRPSLSNRVLATVLFTDLVASTERAAAFGDRAWTTTLDHHEHLVRTQLKRFDGREVRTIGDAFLALFDGPGRAIQCAVAIRESLRSLGFSVRVGLHTGEIELRGDDIAGIGVHIAARIESLAGPSEILVSRTVRDLVAGSGITFADRGVHELKGVPDDWHVYAAEPLAL